MLGRRGHTLILHSLYNRRDETRGNARIRTERLVSSSPASIFCNRHRGCEDPVDSGCLYLSCRGTDDSGDEFRVSRRTKSNIVWEQGGTHDIVMPMNSVSAPDDRYCGAAFRSIDRRAVISVSQVNPILRRGVFVSSGERTATVQNTAQTILSNVIGRQITNFTLNQLSYFLLDGHLSDYRLSTEIHGSSIVGNACATEINTVRSWRRITPRGHKAH